MYLILSLDGTPFFEQRPHSFHMTIRSNRLLQRGAAMLGGKGVEEGGNKN